MNESLDKTTESLKRYSDGAIHFVTRHRVFVVFVIASAAVIAAVIQANSYLNPPRNEALFEEQKTLINYSEIDQEIVEKLETTQDDPAIEVDSDFVPDRTNPFSE